MLPNTPPVATNDSARTKAGRSVAIDVLSDEQARYLRGWLASPG